MHDDMRQKALEYLYKQLKRVKTAESQAKRKKNCPECERAAIAETVAVIDWITDVVQNSAADQAHTRKCQVKRGWARVVNSTKRWVRVDK